MIHQHEPCLVNFFVSSLSATAVSLTKAVQRVKTACAVHKGFIKELSVQLHSEYGR
ncbi:MAG: hypothetical protein ACLRL6_02085 [Clostridium sp.]